MKIIITAQGNEKSSLMDQYFGRAQNFVLWDEENNSIETIDNSKNKAAAHGAGIQAGQLVVDSGADIVISGHVGPKAASVLKAAGKKVFLGNKDKTLEENYQLFKEGKLEEQQL
mgnify:CR=1 FL=1